MSERSTDNRPTEYIEHSAIVTDLSQKEGTVSVVVERDGECGECPAARLCGVKEGTSDRITVSDPRPGRFHIGDKVIIRGTEALHRRAIMICTVVPCILLVIVMTVVYLLSGSQGVAALAGLGSMLLFFLLLYLMRNRISHEFRFILSEGNSDSSNLRKKETNRS